MKDIVICDANHGGLTLLEEYSKYTTNTIFFYDIYNKLSSLEKKELTDRYDVEFIEKEDITTDFTVVAPVHMKPVINKDYTHHEFTSYLIDKHREKYAWNFKIIQVTGVKGKTTTTTIIKELLSDYNVLLLNSNELTYYGHNSKVVLNDSLSITPASIIRGLNIARENNLLDKIDYFIVEVSLGVVVNEEIGVLTNILEDYPIANNTCSASIAKESVFTCKNVICDYDTLKRYYDKKDGRIISTGLDSNADIYASNIKYNIDQTTFTLHYDNGEYEVKCFALTDFYIKNILFSISVTILCGLKIEDILLKLKDVKAISGRTSYKKINDKLIIEEINPGHNCTSIKESIENLKRINDDSVIVLGGDYGITCEEIDEKRLVNFINSNDYEIILTGPLGKNLKEHVESKDILYFNSINESLSYTLEKSDNSIIHVIYRSEYGRDIQLNIGS